MLRKHKYDSRRFNLRLSSELDLFFVIGDQPERLIKDRHDAAFRSHCRAGRWLARCFGDCGARTPAVRDACITGAPCRRRCMDVPLAFAMTELTMRRAEFFQRGQLAFTARRLRNDVS